MYDRASDPRAVDLTELSYRLAIDAIELKMLVVTSKSDTYKLLRRRRDGIKELLKGPRTERARSEDA